MKMFYDSMKTTNKFLFSTDLINYKGKYVTTKYDIIDGIKTGYTTISKNNLVSTAQKNGIRLISVVLKSDPNNIYSDSRYLLDYGFDNYKYHSFTFSGNKITSLPVENGTKNSAVLFSSKTITGLIPKDLNIEEIKEIVNTQSITLPISENQILGSIEYYVKDQLIGRADLVTDEDIVEETLMITLQNHIIKKNGLGQLEYKYYIDIVINILFFFQQSNNTIY